MFHQLCRVLVLVCAVGGLALAGPADAVVTLSPEDISWETVGTKVQFNLRFRNPDATTSGEVNYQVHAQDFGAHVPNQGEIASGLVPPMPPTSFFDVFFEVEVSALPPSAEEITPSASAPSPPNRQNNPACPPDNFWAGNVDVFWIGPGGSGQVQAHYGTIFICPGAGNSYIHVITDCQDPGGISWAFANVCANWTVSLVSDDGFGNPAGPAPNPLPPGFWDGWICISATPAVNVGDVCHFDLNMTCGSQPATITVWAEACDWAATPTEPATWGKIKGSYR